MTQIVSPLARGVSCGRADWVIKSIDLNELIVRQYNILTFNFLANICNLGPYFIVDILGETGLAWHEKYLC